MNSDEIRPGELEIPPRLEWVFGINQPLSRKSLADLKPDDIKVLRRIAVGETPHVTRGNRVRALEVMSRLGGAEECGLVSRIIADDREELELRAVAATNLSFLPPEIAEPELIANLSVKEDLVRIKLIKSLGRIGGLKALEALDRVSDAESDFSKKQLAFAKMLISYRLGLDREDLPFVEGARRDARRGDELIELTVKQAGGAEVKEHLQSLEDVSYGIEIAEEAGFQVSAGDARWMLFLNKKCIARDIASSLAERRMFIGLLARWISAANTYSVQYIVLSRPRGRSTIDFMVVRTDGELFYSGHGSLRGGVMGFSIADIERPGTAPTNITGQLTDRGVELRASVPFKRRKGKRITMDLDRGNR